MLDRRDSDRSAIDAACAVNLVDGGLTALWPVIVYWSLQRAVCPIAVKRRSHRAELLFSALIALRAGRTPTPVLLLPSLYFPHKKTSVLR